MLKWLMELELKDCVKLISNMMIENGIALNDIITDIHNQGKYSSNDNSICEINSKPVFNSFCEIF